LVVKKLKTKLERVRSWVGKGGLLYHFPMMLKNDLKCGKPPTPFKFNQNWLDEEDFKALMIKIGVILITIMDNQQ